MNAPALKDPPQFAGPYLQTLVIIFIATESVFKYALEIALAQVSHCIFKQITRTCIPRLRISANSDCITPVLTTIITLLEHIALFPFFEGTRICAYGEKRK
jgi:hypothetical protein